MNDIYNIIKNSKTIREVLIKLNKNDSSLNYKWFNKYVIDNKIDISHFLNKSEYMKSMHSENKLNKINDDFIFSNETKVARSVVKSRIISNNIIPYECKFCKNKGEWHGKKITLILDHINGISYDNRLENLRFLCPNCNSTLETHCKGHKGLIKDKQSKKPRRLELNSRIKLRKVVRPDKISLEKDIELLGYVGVGKKYGVSDNAIRKWMKTYQKYL
jgi:5-methylcytosine-specific restriction endonuclease McrA